MTLTIKNKVEKVLGKVRTYINMHGGNVELLKVENGTVTLQISGACTHCSLADLTYNKLIGGLLKEEVPEVKNLELKFI